MKVTIIKNKSKDVEKLELSILLMGTGNGAAVNDKQHEDFSKNLK